MNPNARMVNKCLTRSLDPRNILLRKLDASFEEFHGNLRNVVHIIDA